MLDRQIVGTQDFIAIEIGDRHLGRGNEIEIFFGVLIKVVAELGQMALNGSNPVPINSICTIFTQFDAMCFLADGRSKEDVAFGVAESLALRVNKLATQVGVEDQVCMTGGVAKNQAVVRAMSSAIGKPIQPLSVDSQIVGALGAAIYAAERYQ